MAIQNVKSFELGNDDKKANASIKDVKLISKLDAFEKLMKYYGGYEKDNSQKVAPASISFNIIKKESKKESE